MYRNIEQMHMFRDFLCALGLFSFDMRIRTFCECSVGDLDSIQPEVSEFYAARGALVIDESHDQDSTDLQKCLKHILERPKTASDDTPTIIAIGACLDTALCLSPRSLRPHSNNTRAPELVPVYFLC